jgi:hypothetical protein
MIQIINLPVNSVRTQTNPDTVKEPEPPALEAPARRRMGVVEREHTHLQASRKLFNDTAGSMRKRAPERCPTLLLKLVQGHRHHANPAELPAIKPIEETT